MEAGYPDAGKRHPVNGFTTYSIQREAVPRTSRLGVPCRGGSNLHYRPGLFCGFTSADWWKPPVSRQTLTVFRHHSFRPGSPPIATATPRRVSPNRTSLSITAPAMDIFGVKLSRICQAPARTSSSTRFPLQLPALLRLTRLSRDCGWNQPQSLGTSLLARRNAYESLNC